MSSHCITLMSRPVSWRLDTWETQSVARCLDWVHLAWEIGLMNFFASNLLMFCHLEVAIGRPTPSKWSSWFSDFQPFTFPSLINDGDSPFSIHKRNPFLRIMNLKTALLVIFQQNCDKNVQIVDVYCRFFRRHCLSAGGRDDRFCRSSGGIYSSRSELTLAHHVERCAAVHTELLTVVCQRSLKLSFLGSRKKFSHV